MWWNHYALNVTYWIVLAVNWAYFIRRNVIILVSQISRTSDTYLLVIQIYTTGILGVSTYVSINFEFYDRMTVHRNRFLVNKTNRCTEFQFYWYYKCTCLGHPFCPSSGFLSRTSALVHFMQLWWPYTTRIRMERSSILLLVAGSHHNCIKCTKADVRLRNPDDGQKGCPKHVES